WRGWLRNEIRYDDGSGYGCGDGYGDGYGDGHGYGYGAYGYGNGYGEGYGYGDSYGDGDGYGEGNGDGYESGSGHGDGSGDGYDEQTWRDVVALEIDDGTRLGGDVRAAAIGLLGARLDEIAACADRERVSPLPGRTPHWNLTRRERTMGSLEGRLCILGAPVPEMERIEGLLRECGETMVYATTGDGERVTPATAYRCPVPEAPEGATVYAVECIDVLPDGWVRIDHHRPGDPGFGRPPSEFLAASSIGQVIAELARLGRLPETWPRLCTSEGCTWQRGELVTRGGHPAQPHFPLGWWVTTREEGETGDASYGADAGETAEV